MSQLPRHNRCWVIAGRPVGRDVTIDDFRMEEQPVRAPSAGEILVQIGMIAMEPSMKGQMENIGGYAARTEIGDLMRGRGTGTVLISNDAAIPAGSRVIGPFGWQEFACIAASEVELIVDDAPDDAHLGLLGTAGLTAYCGLKHVGQPFPGDVIVVNAATGGVGAVVVQLAKIAGCRVIGIAGGADKCRLLTEELGADAAIDHRNADIAAELARLAPQGIDIIWDNVGGAMLNDMLAHITDRARVVICGGISRSKTGGMPEGPENYFNIVFRSAGMRGFLLHDYTRDFPVARTRLAAWLKEGRIKARVDVLEGIENAPHALMQLFAGTNIGKQLLALPAAEAR